MRPFLLFMVCFFLTSCAENNSLNRGYVITQSHEATEPVMEEPVD